MGIFGKTARASLVALAAVASTVSVAAQSPERNPAAVSQTDPLPRIGIVNFGQVSSAYYRGGKLNPRNALDLATLGVKTVIDLRSDSDYDPLESQFVARSGMKYERIPMTTRKSPTSEQVASFLSLVLDPMIQPVYVHCVEGRHRTGVMTAVYRMTVDGWTAVRAYAEMKHFKFGLDFLHPEFKSFVHAYHPTPAIVPARADEVAATN